MLTHVKNTITKNLNLTQQKAVYEIDKHLYVSASAGTGKTEVLTQRYMHILEQKKATVNQILSITFTEKAAKEMKSRIIKFILTKIAIGKEKQYWKKVKKDFRHANISTIHGFCSKIIRDFAIELGINPDFSIIEEPELKYELHRFIKDSLSKWIEKDSTENNNLTDNVKSLLMEYGFPNLRNMLSNLFFHHFDIDKKIIPLYKKYNTKDDYLNYLKTFIKNEKTYRLKQIIKLKPIKKFCDYICNINLSDYGNAPFSKYLRNIKSIVNSLLNGDIHPDFKKIYKNRKFNKTDKKYWTEKEFNDFFIQLEPLKFWMPEFLIDNGNIKSELGIYTTVKSLISLYNNLAVRAKSGDNIILSNWLNHSLLTYDDLQYLALKLLSDEAYEGVIEHEIKNKYKYIMVDESQDIDKIQRDIISNMVSLGDSHPNLFVVGDSKQSIYKFRGADISVFHNLINSISLNSNKHYSLDINYRSQKGLVDFTNILFSKLMDEKFDDFEVDYCNPVKGERENDLSCNVEIMLHQEDKEKEANQIAKKIISIVEENQLNRKVNYRDITILFRALTNVSTYERALLDYGIPYTIVSSREFYKLQEIVDCLTFLKIVDNIDSINLCGILRSPFCGISDNGLFWLVNYKDNSTSLLKGFFDINNNEYIDSKDKEKLIFFKGVLEDIINKKDKLKIHELLKLAINNTGYTAVLLSHTSGEQKKHNVDYFISKVRKLEQNRFFSIKELLDYIENLNNFDYQENPPSHYDSNNVNIMTIHKAKGMEFPIVILANIDKKNVYNNNNLLIHPDLGIGLKCYSDENRKFVNSYLYDYLKMLEKRKEVAESKRLFYVGVTRAKDYLILSGKVSLSKNKKITIKSDYSYSVSWLNYFIYVFTKENKQLEEAINTNKDYNFKGYNGDTLFRVTWDVKGDFKKVNNINKKLLNFDVLKSSMLINALYTSPLKILSPTALVVYEKCQRKFYYKFISQIRESIESKLGGRLDDDLSVNIPMNLIGNMVHKVLEKFSASSNNLKGIVLSYLNDQKLSALSKKEDRQKIMDYIKSMIKTFIDSDFYNKIKQSEITYPLEHYNEFEFIYKFGDIYLQGAIDKVYFDKDKGLTLLDYKTNKITNNKNLEKKIAEHNLQLKLYYIAVSEMITKVEHTILHFLDINKSVDIISSVDFAMMKSEMKVLIEELKSKLKTTNVNSFKTQVSKADCYFCGYWMCENKG